jgi:hypothetical protein
MRQGNLIFLEKTSKEFPKAKKEIILKEDMPFPLLQYFLKKIKKEPAFLKSKGELRIVIFGKKFEKKQVEIPVYDDFLRNN